ncbi:unnamed protein product [Larinioides sclopetarius]|uniref:Uncharacterized protein n=1 Tax=Larinioides sclopetarius TaxID=280406 RepID=A0AAV2BF40_9ARAC
MPHSKVEVADIKRILIFDGYVTQALWLLWCSSTYLLSFISSQLHLLTMKTLVALVFLFLAILSVASALPVYTYGYPYAYAPYAYGYDYGYVAPYSAAYYYPWFKR